MTDLINPADYGIRLSEPTEVCGNDSHVFFGEYQGEPVALKVYYRPGQVDLTTVERYKRLTNQAIGEFRRRRISPMIIDFAPIYRVGKLGVPDSEYENCAIAISPFIPGDTVLERGQRLREPHYKERYLRGVTQILREGLKTEAIEIVPVNAKIQEEHRLVITDLCSHVHLLRPEARLLSQDKS